MSLLFLAALAAVSLAPASAWQIVYPQPLSVVGSPLHIILLRTGDSKETCLHLDHRKLVCLDPRGASEFIHLTNVSAGHHTIHLAPPEWRTGPLRIYRGGADQNAEDDDPDWRGDPVETPRFPAVHFISAAVPVSPAPALPPGVERQAVALLLSPGDNQVIGPGGNCDVIALGRFLPLGRLSMLSVCLEVDGTVVADGCTAPGDPIGVWRLAGLAAGTRVIRVTLRDLMGHGLDVGRSSVVV
eukprot:g6063.t1